MKTLLRFLVTLFAVGVLLPGCAGNPETAVAPGKRVSVYRASSADTHWWRACFRMPRDEAGQPRWAMDLLLADQVVAPVLRQYEGNIPLWRFHRRAGRDTAGHQFSLIFYSDASTAASVFDALEQAPALPPLLEQNYLRGPVNHCGRKSAGKALSATSDPAWDPRLQRSWPYFIMGVSAHWLSLIEETGRAMPYVASTPAEQLAYYASVQEEITTLWKEQGQHAYLHHLNALFGYEPLHIKKLMRF